CVGNSEESSRCGVFGEMCIEALGKEAASRPRFGLWTERCERESLGGYKLQCYKLIFRSAAHRFLDDFLCLSLANERTPRKSALFLAVASWNEITVTTSSSILLSGGIFARRDQSIRHEGAYIGARVYYGGEKRKEVYTLRGGGGGGGGSGGSVSETYIRACKPRRKPTAYTKSALALAIK
ncbi:hypothetical protein ALC57_12660, partial [Trachymyrmex cornetzi]